MAAHRDAGLAIDRWDGPGHRSLGVVAVSDGQGFAALVRHDLATGTWEAGARSFPAGAVRPGRAWLEAAVALDGADRTDLEDLGLFGGHPALAERVSGFLRGDPWASPFRDGGIHDEAEDRPRSVGRDRSAAMSTFMLPRSGRPLPDVTEADYGFQAEAWGRLRGDRAAGAGVEPHLGGEALAWIPGPPTGKAIGDLVAARLAAAVATLAGPDGREALAILGREGWSNHGHAFYASPGRAGMRRRQAGRIYPAFAPLIASRPAIVGLVDAGRPFEAALAADLAGLLAPAHRAGMDVAALRRMRTLPHLPFERLREAVELAARVPRDWLPRDRDGWLGFLDELGGALDGLWRTGIEPAGLLARVGGDWRALARGARHAAGPARRAGWFSLTDADGLAGLLSAAGDVSAYLADTLVRHLRESMGVPATEGGDRRLAGAILFHGRSVQSIERLQARWHAGLDRLRADLPAHEAGNAWPAAFQPFRAPNGLDVVCLTDEAQLKAEGCKGIDAEGREGLDHCVGGYGRRCHAGESHVASVRRPVGAGFERVSTLEFTPHLHENGMVLFLDQHLGRRNAPPVPGAAEAVEALARAVAEGRHAVDPESTMERDGDGYRDSWDWRTPGAMAQAFGAWAPYLPRSARGGLDALRALLASEAERLGPAGPTALPDGTAVLDVEVVGMTLR